MLFLSILILSGTPLACATVGAEPATREQSIADIYERVHTGVVTLRTVSRGPRVETMGMPVEQEGTGSGVIISKSGEILTAAHLVQTAEQVLVEFHDGSRKQARIVSSDPLTDLALVRLVGPAPKNLTVVELGDSDRARVGEQVFAVGTPLGVSHTLTVGYLSARRISRSLVDERDLVEVLQTDAAINPGNSGGPLFNMQGEVIGVISYISSVTGGNQGVGFAVSAKTCRERFLDRAPLWSGVEFVSLRGRAAELLNVPGGKCALLVQRVAKKSPADRLGLRGGDVAADIKGQALLLGGDIVLSVQGIGLDEDGALTTIRDRLAKLGVGDEIEVTVLRAGEQIALTGPWKNTQ